MEQNVSFVIDAVSISLGREVFLAPELVFARREPLHWNVTKTLLIGKH